jgi:hypothetical protein
MIIGGCFDFRCGVLCGGIGCLMVMEDGPSTSNREDSIANRNGSCGGRVTMRFPLISIKRYN